MTASAIFFLLLLLACPLMMVLMMRGGHGHRGDASGHQGGCHGGRGQETEQPERSIDDLRQERLELDRLIGEWEAAEHQESNREGSYSGTEKR